MASRFCDPHCALVTHENINKAWVQGLERVRKKLPTLMQVMCAGNREAKQD
jgi:hypothetical protein